MSTDAAVAPPRRARQIKIERIKIVSREQWIAARAGDVTASTVAALFGLHPHETAMGVWAAKTGIEMPDEDNAAMRRGRLLEGAVATAFLEEHRDWTIKKANIYLRAPDLRLGATPDFFVIDPKGRKGILQAKTVAPHVFKREWTDNTAPTWILLQTLTEAMLARAEFGVIAALVCDGFRFDLHTYDVPRHEAAERRIQDTVARFWDDIANGREPKIDYERDASLLAVMYPREVPGKTIDLRGDNALPRLLWRRDLIKSGLDRLAARKEAIETELKAKMGDAEMALIADGWRATLKKQDRKEYTVKATSFRVLRVARDKQEKAA
jgi:predicted phage-related endonuclease